jgi:hypothetical protein
MNFFCMMTNGLGMECPRWATPALAGGAREAACSVHGSPSGWRNESNSFDFHELRQGRYAVPPIQGNDNGLGTKCLMIGGQRLGGK